MSKKLQPIVLTTVDDIFSVENTRTDATEHVIDVPLEQIHDFKGHPFQVRMDAEMLDFIESIKEYGVLEPGLARPRKEGGYELIAGHRRRLGSLEAELSTMPLIIKEMDDDTATILMVHSNKQRENILHSERAWALKMLLDALNRQGQRTDLTSSGIRKESAKSWSIDEAIDKFGMKKTKIYDCISLTKLILPLLQMVDDNHLIFSAAVQLSCLKQGEQELLHETIMENGISLSLSQAEELRRLSQTNGFTGETLVSFFSSKPTASPKRSFPLSKVRSFFPSDYTSDQMEQIICKLVEEWSQANQGVVA